MRTIALLLSNHLPPTGTFTGTRTDPSDPQPGHPGSEKTSHNPTFSTRPLPRRSNVLFRLIHRSVPWLVNAPFTTTVVLTGPGLALGLLATAFEAVNRGYSVVVPREAVADIDPEFGQIVWERTFRLIAARTSVAELVAIWRAS